MSKKAQTKNKTKVALQFNYDQVSENKKKHIQIVNNQQNTDILHDNKFPFVWKSFAHINKCLSNEKNTFSVYIMYICQFKTFQFKITSTYKRTTSTDNLLNFICETLQIKLLYVINNYTIIINGYKVNILNNKNDFGEKYIFNKYDIKSINNISLIKKFNVVKYYKNINNIHVKQ